MDTTKKEIPTATELYQLNSIALDRTNLPSTITFDTYDKFIFLTGIGYKLYLIDIVPEFSGSQEIVALREDDPVPKTEEAAREHRFDNVFTMELKKRILGLKDYIYDLEL